MHPPSIAEARPRGGRRREKLAAWASLLLLAGCTQAGIPPFLPDAYVRLSTVAMGQDLEVLDDESSGPYPGVELTAGVIVQQDATSALSLEGSGEAFDFESGGDVKGTGYARL